SVLWFGGGSVFWFGCGSEFWFGCGSELWFGCGSEFWFGCGSELWFGCGSEFWFGCGSEIRIPYSVFLKRSEIHRFPHSEDLASLNRIQAFRFQILPCLFPINPLCLYSSCVIPF